MTEISIVASGMVTAVGFNSPASCAAIRAGISGVKPANLWEPEAGDYMNAARPRLPQWWEGVGKLAELAAPAVHECLLAADPVPPNEIPILLGVASAARPHRDPAIDDVLLGEVEYRLGLPHHRASRIIAADQVSGVLALLEARRLIRSNEAPCCIVAGTDSFLSQNVVDAYRESRRIMTATNSNGFFPGEAAGAVLVRPATRSAEPELRVLGLGTSTETATIESETPLRCDGLASAVRSALGEAGLEFHNIDYRITDLNGEHYKFKEAALLLNRVMRKLKVERFHLWHPIEFVGEIGAAIGSCAFAVALHAAQRGYAPGPMVLCHFGSDHGGRAAAVLARQ